jgi:hypothetical protein
VGEALDFADAAAQRGFSAAEHEAIVEPVERIGVATELRSPGSDMRDCRKSCMSPHSCGLRRRSTA